MRELFFSTFRREKKKKHQLRALSTKNHQLLDLSISLTPSRFRCQHLADFAVTFFGACPGKAQSAPTA
jgi:hypothetical protein